MEILANGQLNTNLNETRDDSRVIAIQLIDKFKFETPQRSLIINRALTKRTQNLVDF